jgi:hypothetical protein
MQQKGEIGDIQGERDRLIGENEEGSLAPNEMIE